MNKHIILIGFKNVGKSAIGKELAKQMAMRFVDLDEEMEKAYNKKHGARLNCRQIMLKEGQKSFRTLEHEVLQVVLAITEVSVIALGGGTPIYENNDELLKQHTLVQITAPKNIVYERIMVNGRPAFFSPDEHPLESFNRIWDERKAKYDSLSKIKINNLGTIEQAVDEIKNLIKLGLTPFAKTFPSVIPSESDGFEDESRNPLYIDN